MHPPIQRECFISCSCAIAYLISLLHPPIQRECFIRFAPATRSALVCCTHQFKGNVLWDEGRLGPRRESVAPTNSKGMFYRPDVLPQEVRIVCCTHQFKGNVLLNVGCAKVRRYVCCTHQFKGNVLCRGTTGQPGTCRLLHPPIQRECFILLVPYVE